MSRDRFKQVMYSPYFQSNHYLEETKEGKYEQKIFSILDKINIFKRKKNDKNKKYCSK